MKFDILAQFIALELGRAKRAKKSQKRVFRRAGSTGFGAEFELRREDLHSAYGSLGYANYRIASDCKSRDRALRLKPEVCGKTSRLSKSDVIVKRRVNKIYRENLERCGLRFRSEAGDLASASRANGYKK